MNIPSVAVLTLPDMEDALERLIKRILRGLLRPLFEEVIDQLRQRREKGILTLEETAELLDVKPETVRTTYVPQGLRCFKPGKSLLFRLVDIEAWVAKYPVKCSGSPDIAEQVSHPGV
jgi:hypothetical protein